jgi:P27 family predicted phage terminase small subunit
MADQLSRLGLLTSIDATAFAAYCTVKARWLEAEQALTKTGTVVKSPSGYPILSPYLSVANRALEQMRMYLIEFGLTPASRTRISVRPSEEENGPFSEFCS